ncbi:MAG: PHP domain-containing protein [Chitinivibrionales bacterium]|nr:PHP domain-containing protein [Chitinivibrionales bacterium]
MLQIDFHVHSHFSLCGVHSVLEMLEQGKKRGLTAMAITDHGPALNSRIPPPFYDRLFDPVPGIIMLKGTESNLISLSGEIDFPEEKLQYVDIVLCGIHHKLMEQNDSRAYTDAMIAAIKRNPQIDIITHPETPNYPLDIERLARTAVEHGVALEINNSKILCNRFERSSMEKSLSVYKRMGCRIAVCSDAHAINEVGLDDSVQPLVEAAGYPDELIVTKNAQAGLAFIEERRKNKKKY